MLKSSQQALGVLSQFKDMIGAVIPDFRQAAPDAAQPAANPVAAPPAKARPASEALKRSAPEQSLIIPVVQETPAEAARREIQERGQFLARQDRWPELLEQIAEADRHPLQKPGEVPKASLLAYGARADVVNAVEHALSEGQPGNDADDGRSLIEGVMALEAVRTAHRHDPNMAALLAMAHADIGWAWRGPSSAPRIPPLNRRRCAAHFDRAATLLAPFEEQSAASPLLAAARCALLAGRNQGTMQVADDYAALIALDPCDHRHMRALGNHMLPRWFGSYSALELEARRTAAQTEEIWGAGGYTWVYFDAIALDPQACARVDTHFFLDGLRDIISICPDQEMANLLSAFCAVALRRQLGQSEQADLPRLQIAEASDWLIRSHLHELHPLVWAHAAEGFDNSVRVSSVRRFAARGEADALAVIADHFHEEISSGQKITFSPAGLSLARH